MSSPTELESYLRTNKLEFKKDYDIAKHCLTGM